MKSQNINIRVDPEMKAKLQNLADRKKLNLNQYCELIFNNHIKTHDHV